MKEMLAEIERLKAENARLTERLVDVAVSHEKLFDAAKLSIGHAGSVPMRFTPEEAIECMVHRLKEAVDHAIAVGIE